MKTSTLINIIQLVWVSYKNRHFSLKYNCKTHPKSGLFYSSILVYLAQPPDDKNYFEPGTLLGRAEYTGSYVQCLWAEATHKPVYITIPIVGRVKVGDHNFDAHYCKERYIPADNSSLVGVSEYHFHYQQVTELFCILNGR